MKQVNKKVEMKARRIKTGLFVKIHRSVNQYQLANWMMN